MYINSRHSNKSRLVKETGHAWSVDKLQMIEQRKNLYCENRCL